MQWWCDDWMRISWLSAGSETHESACFTAECVCHVDMNCCSVWRRRARVISPIVLHLFSCRKDGGRSRVSNRKIEGGGRHHLLSSQRLLQRQVFLRGSVCEQRCSHNQQGGWEPKQVQHQRPGEHVPRDRLRSDFGRLGDVLVRSGTVWSRHVHHGDAHRPPRWFVPLRFDLGGRNCPETSTSWWKHCRAFSRRTKRKLNRCSISVSPSRFLSPVCPQQKTKTYRNPPARPFPVSGRLHQLRQVLLLVPAPQDLYLFQKSWFTREQVSLCCWYQLSSSSCLSSKNGTETAAPLQVRRPTISRAATCMGGKNVDPKNTKQRLVKTSHQRSKATQLVLSRRGFLAGAEFSQHDVFVFSMFNTESAYLLSMPLDCSVVFPQRLKMSLYTQGSTTTPQELRKKLSPVSRPLQGDTAAATLQPTFTLM